MTDDHLGEVRIWEVPSGKLLFILEGQGQGISSASFSADGLTLATDSRDVARLWSLRTGRELMSFNDTSSLEFAPDGRVIAQVKKDNTLYLVHLPTLLDIDDPQPKPVAQLVESAKSPAGVFEPVMTKTAAVMNNAAASLP